jgi:hypothetical protein
VKNGALFLSLSLSLSPSKVSPKVSSLIDSHLIHSTLLFFQDKL